MLVEKRRIVSRRQEEEAAAVLLHQIYRRPLHLRLVHLHTLCCTCIPSKYHMLHQNFICCACILCRSGAPAAYSASASLQNIRCCDAAHQPTRIGNSSSSWSSACSPSSSSTSSSSSLSLLSQETLKRYRRSASGTITGFSRDCHIGLVF